MKHIMLASAVVTLAISNVAGQDLSVNSLLSDASVAQPNDARLVGRVIAVLNLTSDTRLIVTLKELFGKATEKRVRQSIATALFKHAGGRDIYFNELLKYAKIAIDKAAPPTYESDEQGNDITDHLSPNFESWCEGNGLQKADCLKEVWDQPLDVWLLAELKDRRAIPLLRQGLDVTNPLTVEMAVKGLALLNDSDAIPVIASKLDRFRPKVAQRIAAATSAFNDPRVGALLDRFVIDRKWRQEIEESIRERSAQRKQQ